MCPKKRLFLLTPLVVFLLWQTVLIVYLWNSHYIALAYSAQFKKKDTAIPAQPSLSQKHFSFLSEKFSKFRNQANKTLVLQAKEQKLRSFPRKYSHAWFSFVQGISKNFAIFSVHHLKKFRNLLEVESDVDRNMYFDFPERLSNAIVEMIISIDIRTKTTTYKQSNTKKEKNFITTKVPIIRMENPKIDDNVYLSPFFLKRKASNKHHVFTDKDLHQYKNVDKFLQWPLKTIRITSHYGWRQDPLTKHRSFHRGIDLGAKFGTYIRAAISGKVVETGWMGTCGLGVYLKHRMGYSTCYCHLSQILSIQGDWLKKGQILGRIGSTGRSTATHLHFGLFRNQKSIDPLLHLPLVRNH